MKVHLSDKFMLKEDIPKDDIEKEIENIAEKASSSSNEDLAKSVAEQISTLDQKYECIVSDYPILSPHEFHEVQVKSSKYVACFKVYYAHIFEMIFTIYFRRARLQNRSYLVFGTLTLPYALDLKLKVSL